MEKSYVDVNFETEEGISCDDLERCMNDLETWFNCSEYNGIIKIDVGVIVDGEH